LQTGAAVPCPIENGLGRLKVWRGYGTLTL
jgi:hypothetical protein